MTYQLIRGDATSIPLADTLRRYERMPSRRMYDQALRQRLVLSPLHAVVPNGQDRMEQTADVGRAVLGEGGQDRRMLGVDRVSVLHWLRASEAGRQDITGSPCLVGDGTRRTAPRWVGAPSHMLQQDVCASISPCARGQADPRRHAQADRYRRWAA